MNSKLKLIFVLMLIGITFSGCIGVNRSFREVRNTVIDNLDEDLDGVIELSVGPAGIALATAIVSFADTEVDAASLVAKIDRVQLSVYERPNPESPDFSILNSVSKTMLGQGWKPIVKVRDGNELAGVFIDANSNDLSKMFVIALSDEELVMVEVVGDLDELIELAIKEHGLNFEHENF